MPKMKIKMKKQTHFGRRLLKTKGKMSLNFWIFHNMALSMNFFFSLQIFNWGEDKCQIQWLGLDRNGLMCWMSCLRSTLTIMTTTEWRYSDLHLFAGIVNRFQQMFLFHSSWKHLKTRAFWVLSKVDYGEHCSEIGQSNMNHQPRTRSGNVCYSLALWTE